MNRKSSHQSVSLGELLDGSMKLDKGKKPSRAMGILGYFAATLAVGLAVGSLGAPGAMLASKGVSSSIDFYNSLPDNIDFVATSLPQHTILLDKNGNEFARFFSENREEVPLDKVAPVFTKALIASEDARFYEHGGFDPIGTTRALVNNAMGGASQGGSTLTQQVVKNMLVLTAAAKGGDKSAVDSAVTGPRDYLTKLKELRMAVAVDKKYTKDQILSLYMNSVYFGNGAYGIKAASNEYFAVDPDKLTASQSATLVAMVQSPNVYNPIDNPKVSLQQRDLVLGRMLATQAITQEQYDAAKAEKVVVKTKPVSSGCNQSKYANYCNYVMSELKKNPAFGTTQAARDARIAQGGITVTTALDPVATDKATDEIMKAIGDKNRVAIASATVEPGTGKLTAIAQSRAYGSGDFQTEISYADSKFSVGSSFKPFTIATALEQGISPTLVLNSDSHYHSPIFDGPPDGYSNYGLYNWGNKNMYEATQLSLNTYYIKLLEKVGVRNDADMAKKLGIVNLPPTDSFTGKEGSLTLGANELTPIEMADAYATFASGGMHCNPISILSAVKTQTGEVIKVPSANCQQVVSSAVANGVTDVIKHDFEAPGTAQHANLAGGRVAAGKTGTTENYAETWFVGYTPQLSTAVWIGDPRGGQQYPLDSLTIFGKQFSSATGEDIAAPVWRNIMDRLLEGTPNVGFPAPGGSPVTSTPTPSIPNVQGMEINKAVTLLSDAGFTPVIAPMADTKDGLPAGVVTAQTPAAGGAVGNDSVITLTLSKGSDTKMTIPQRGGK